MKIKTPDNKLTKKKKITTTKDLSMFFIVFFIASFFVCTVLAASSGGDAWKTMLFQNDMFMDFFNSIRDAGAEDAYTARNNIYPPLGLLIFKILGFLIDGNLVDLPNKQKYLLQSDQRAMMIYILFACILILSMSTIINSYVNRLKWENNRKQASYHTLLSFLMIVSYPVMYCIERGNIIIVSMIFTMFFVFFKDSENKIIKECSYIALAIAAGIKLYPAIFGLMLLFDKKYKDAVRLVVYGITAIVVPFIFFIQPETASVATNAHPILASIANNNVLAATGRDSPILNIIENLLSFATKKSKLNFSSVSIQNFIFIFDPKNTSLANAAMFLTEGIAFAALLFVKKKWQQVFLITYLMLNIPSASSSYALTFLIIPFMMFLFDDKGNGYSCEKRPEIDWIYIFCFALLLTPLPILWYYHQDTAREIFNSLGIAYQSKINQVVAGFVYQYMTALVIIEIFSKLIKEKKANNKNKQIEDVEEVA